MNRDGRVLNEPSVYSVLPSNTLAYTIQKLLASEPSLFRTTKTPNFHSQRAPTVRDGR